MQRTISGLRRLCPIFVGAADSREVWLPCLQQKGEDEIAWRERFRRRTFRTKLTVSAGLRWDPNYPLIIAGGHGAGFMPGQQSTRYPNAPLGLVFVGDKGIGPGVMPITHGYSEPRFGDAWQVRPDPVVRAAFGMFTAPMEDAFYAWDAAPFAPPYTLLHSAVPLGGSRRIQHTQVRAARFKPGQLELWQDHRHGQHRPAGGAKRPQGILLICGFLCYRED
jgi:hypothetical protein